MTAHQIINQKLLSIMKKYLSIFQTVKSILLAIFFGLLTTASYSQDDLLSLFGDEEETIEYAAQIKSMSEYMGRKSGSGCFALFNPASLRAAQFGCLRTVGPGSGHYTTGAGIRYQRLAGSGYRPWHLSENF